MEQKVEISKSDHALDLLAKFDDFRKTNKHCDFIIRAGKKEMPVHKFVISASSEYFEAMLSHDTIESKQGLVEIKQADPECIVKCVDFIYTGEASVSNDKQRDLMHVAHMLRLERLYNGVATFLEKKLDCSSFYSTREIANLYECKNLVKICNEFAMKNFRALAELDDFKKLEVEYVKFLLSADGLKGTDTVKCKSLMMWINYESDRAASLFDLMKAIDFGKISMSYRRFLTENEPAILNSNECLRHLFKSVFDTTGTRSHDATLREHEGIIVLDSSSSRLKCFDLTEKTWKNMRVMHQDMVNQCTSVVVSEEYMYVFTEDRMTYRLLFKKPDSDWEQMASRSGNWGPAVFLNGMIYCTEHGHYSRRIERYNIQQNNWSFVGNRPIKTHAPALAVLQESLFVIGGHFSTGQSSRDVHRFQLATSSWSTAPSLNQERYLASATVLNEAIYIFGGQASQIGRVKSVEILYHNSWQLVNLDGFGPQSFSCYAIDEKIYLVGSNSSSFKEIKEYDPNSRKIQTVCTFPDLSVPFFASVAATIHEFV